MDWFDGAEFTARAVLSSDRFADLDDDAALARQFVFLDTLAIAPCAEAAAEATPLRRIQAAGLDVDVIAEDPVVAVVKSFASRGECDAMQSLAAHGGAGGGRRSEGAWSHDDPSTGFRRRLGLTYDWDLVGNETLPAALLNAPLRWPKPPLTYACRSGLFRTPEPRGVRSIRLLRAALRRSSVSAPGSKPGGRVATMLLVCEAPTLGGATAFPRHHGRALTLRPATGDAVFFAYDKNARGVAPRGLSRARRRQARRVNLALRDGVTASSPASHYDVDGGAAVGVNVAGENV